MINKDEILAKSKEFEIHTSNVQRDYIFGWLLAGIYTECQLKDYFVLKGGNCFRKAYFKNTRFSNDLDFSLSIDLKEEYIKSELNKACDFVQMNTGIVFDKEKSRVNEKKRVDPSNKVYDARVYFMDFFGEESRLIISIRLDISRFDKIYLPIQQRLIIHPYSDHKFCSNVIHCVKIEELLATKLKCLLQRRHVADLYDYIFSIFFNTGLNINRAEIVSTLLKMTIFERNPGILKNLFIGLPFEFFKRFWKRYIISPILGKIDFNKAIIEFKNHISDLFEGLPIGIGEKSFFPAEFRNTILEAGSGMNLLEVVYDGFTRIVEPYSLIYKTRRDGVSKEYFYVWDRTGGKSSLIGIKAFIHPKIQSMKLMEEKFYPRFEVELSKAGEKAKKSHFGKPFSKKNNSKSKRNSHSIIRRNSVKPEHFGSFGPTYIIECPLCGKKFRRSKQSTFLNRHKDKYGNYCFGRTGFIADIKH
ncbi:MAG: nucleotidyl transferase AbiEii/AbiGii toxin family protein [Candidatus Aminicenantes bacterium]|nr:nucleotidyl transferase AbiEii/AbiGii toxin family protein [Candidatus Aminicenantes bacterium]